jgi:hypothetical protein
LCFAQIENARCDEPDIRAFLLSDICSNNFAIQFPLLQMALKNIIASGGTVITSKIKLFYISLSLFLSLKMADLY